MKAAFLVAALMCAAPLAPGAAAAKVVRQLHVVHRHGGRTPEVKVGMAELCGAVGCGQLTDVGDAQMQSLGRYLRGKYDALLGAEYDPHVVRSQSTDYPRTVQSAVALLRGAFPGSTAGASDPTSVADVSGDATARRKRSAARLPVVHMSGPKVDDTLLRGIELMSWWVPQMAGMSVHQPAVPPASLFESFAADYEAMVAEARQPGCSKKTGWGLFYCTTTLYDILESLTSTGRLAEIPKLVAHKDALATIRAYWSETGFNYTTDGSEPAEGLMRGSTGFELAQRITGDMRRHVADAAAPLKPLKYGVPRSRVFHYSGHDITLSPLSTAIGAPQMLPPYGAAYVFELLEETAAAAEAGKWSVRVRYSSPGQLPAEAFADLTEGKWTDVAVGCASNATDLSPRSGECALEAFAGYVAATGPRSPLGSCYVPEGALQKIKCYGGDKTGTSSTCRRYRHHCRTSACPANMALVGDGADMHCASLAVPEIGGNSPSTSAVASLGAGVAIAAAAAALLA